MKILQLGKFYPPDIGGIEFVMYNITEQLNKIGIKCDVLCSNSKNEYSEEIISGYKVLRAKSYGKFASISIAPQMILKLKEIVDDYDIVHVHHPDPMANLALFLVNPKKQKVVLHWHSDIIKPKVALKVYEPLLNWMLRKADVIIGTSPQYIQESEQLKNFKNKCIVVALGIRKEDLDAKIAKIITIREKFKNKKIVFSLGRFVPYKGFEYLIESAKYLPANYVILIGGDGDLRQKYSELVINHNLQNKVFLIGKIHQSELGSYYKACDLFCLPSIMKSEAFGLVIVEAMSFGKPVVATKIKGSGVSWVNQDGITGLNVEPRNPKQLAEAIKYILEDDKVYQKFSENAYRRFLSEFTIEREVNKLIEVYDKIISYKKISL